MSLIKFVEAKSNGVVIEDKTQTLLRDLLQPNTKRTLRSTAREILNLLSNNAPPSNDVWTWGETVIELAEQIPYNHPSHIKLAALLEFLSKSTKFSRAWTLEVMLRYCRASSQP